MRITSGELQIDGTSVAAGVLYHSPEGGLTTIPNGAPIGKFDVSGGSLNGITSGPVYVGPTGELTATPNGRPRGLLR